MPQISTGTGLKQVSSIQVCTAGFSFQSRTEREITSCIGWKGEQVLMGVGNKKLFEAVERE